MGTRLSSGDVKTHKLLQDLIYEQRETNALLRAAAERDKRAMEYVEDQRAHRQKRMHDIVEAMGSGAVPRDVLADGLGQLSKTALADGLGQLAESGPDDKDDDDVYPRTPPGTFVVREDAKSGTKILARGMSAPAPKAPRMVLIIDRHHPDVERRVRYFENELAAGRPSFVVQLERVGGLVLPHIPDLYDDDEIDVVGFGNGRVDCPSVVREIVKAMKRGGGGFSSGSIDRQVTFYA